MLLRDIASLVRLSITVSSELPPCQNPANQKFPEPAMESLYEVDYNIAPDDTSIIAPAREARYTSLSAVRQERYAVVSCEAFWLDQTAYQPAWLNIDDSNGNECFCLPMTKGQILRVDPAAGIAGGEVVIDCADFDTSEPARCAIWFHDEKASIVALGSKRVLAIVPELKESGNVKLTLESSAGRTADAALIVGRKLAEDLHPVASPAFDPDDGSLFVTRSGPRGEQLPVSLFRISTNGEISEFSGDITNPTGIAFDRDGQMFVSSRMDGTVYRITPFKEALPFAKNLGIATGMAFDRAGTMYVGDRTGTIYKVNGIGEEQPWVQLEPSVSAYHLAFGPDDALYVTGPTVTSFDSIIRIGQNGEIGVFYKGLGRPQGLAFDAKGNLYVAASLRGRRGIVRISRDGTQADLFVAGMNLVGLAFSSLGDLIVASNDSVYSLPMGINGALLR